MECAPLFFSGPWDAVVLPVDQFFGPWALPRDIPLVVWGPPDQFRAAWQAGAWDYLKDPWSAEELVLRLRGPEPPSVRWDTSTGQAELRGAELSLVGHSVERLTAAEAQMLRLLVLRRGTAVSRAVLAWSARCGEGRVVDTLVGRLRQKLIGAGVPAPEGPVAVRGLGYRLS